MCFVYIGSISSRSILYFLPEYENRIKDYELDMGKFITISDVVELSRKTIKMFEYKDIKSYRKKFNDYSKLNLPLISTYIVYCTNVHVRKTYIHKYI